MLASPSLWKVIAVASVTYIIFLQINLKPQFSPPSPDYPPLSSNDSGIPKKIWQTWHHPAISLNETEKERVQTWLTLNSDYRYELLTDASATSFIQRHYGTGDLKWVGDVYLALNDTILKADFLRYLVLHASGGVYADMDVSCLMPIRAWAPPDLLSSAAVIVGIESDRHPVENDWKLYSDYRTYIWGLNNWTIAARARHPFFRTIIESVAQNLIQLAKKKGKGLGEIDVLYKDVIDATGPRAFSEAFLVYASRALGRKVEYTEASLLEQPKFVADVLVLPIRAMSMLEANRGDGDGARSLGLESVVRHWSQGTWKANHFVVFGKPPEGWQGVGTVEGV